MLWAQSNTPKYSNEFLSIGVSGRALAMANAYTAVSDDVTSGYWNPAGLLNIQHDYEGSLMHAQYFAGIANYDYLGIATRIDSVSVISLSVIRFGVDDIPDTRFLYDANGALNYDNIRFFSAADYGILLSYARRLNIFSGVDVGGSVKIVHRNVGNFANSWGYGLDAGIQKRFNSWGVGLMLKDISGTFNAWSHNSELLVDIYTQTNNVIPDQSLEITLPRAILGFYRKWDFKNSFSVLASTDLEITFDGQRNTLVKSSFAAIDPRIGAEVGYEDKFFLRLGAGQFQDIQDFDGSSYKTFQPNFGIGIKLNNVAIDYALTDIGDQSESPYSHVISLKAGLNDKKE
ncbi:MAG: hypothetical protein JXQ96_08030 [Cyclobacteriaceae bacterium]